jgi:signal transduction histidine kinase
VLGQKATQIDYVLPTNSLFAETLSPTGSSYLEAEGSYLRVSGLDDKERIISYHRVGDYPLMVFVSTTTDETLAGWRSSSFVAVILCGAFSIVLFFLSMALLFSLRRLDEKNAALQRSEREAISASMAKSTFLAAISHELRTPLTSIRGYAELLELKVENPSQKEQAGLIRRGSEHLNALLSEILDFAKAETGAMTVTLETFNVRQLVRSCTDLFGVTAASKNLAFNVHIDEAVPESIVCDGLRLRQILNNLLSNALKFTQSGTVGVEVSVQDEKLSFMVADTGPGIPDDKFDLVFEKFMHANDRVSNEHGGTGLGLALSKALAELMSGTVKLQSKVGEGSKFTVLIPLKTEIEPAALPVAPPSAS